MQFYLAVNCIGSQTWQKCDSMCYLTAEQSFLKIEICSLAPLIVKVKTSRGARTIPQNHMTYLNSTQNALLQSSRGIQAPDEQALVKNTLNSPDDLNCQNVMKLGLNFCPNQEQSRISKLLMS